jgi:phosphonate transport system substrate-binding protein
LAQRILHAEYCCDRERLMRIWMAIFLTVLLSACARPTEQTIHLTELQSLPVAEASAVVPLRISVAAVVSPRGTLESYQPLLNYLSHRLGRPVELVQRRTYAETNDLVEQGDVDLAFVCTSAYIAGSTQFGMELLAAPQVNDATVYHSLLIVRTGSAIQNLADLRGKTFAFTDPISYSGRVYPTALVYQLGATPDTFFGRIFYTYSHDNAIRAVAEGVADGAAVDSLVYDYALERDPTLAQQVRIIHESPPAGIPPVVVNPHIRPQLKATLRDLLLGMDDNPEGQQVLQALGIQRFVSIDDHAYDSVRTIIRSIGPLTL